MKSPDLHTHTKPTRTEPPTLTNNTSIPTHTHYDTQEAENKKPFSQNRHFCESQQNLNGKVSTMLDENLPKSSFIKKLFFLIKCILV